MLNLRAERSFYYTTPPPWPHGDSVRELELLAAVEEPTDTQTARRAELEQSLDGVTVQDLRITVGTMLVGDESAYQDRMAKAREWFEETTGHDPDPDAWPEDEAGRLGDMLFRLFRWAFCLSCTTRLDMRSRPVLDIESKAKWKTEDLPEEWGAPTGDENLPRDLINMWYVNATAANPGFWRDERKLSKKVGGVSIG